MFELSQLRCFVAVAEELHFGRAAERLHMTQPPLSRQVRLLEHQVGTELLERNSRSVKLTAAGRSRTSGPAMPMSRARPCTRCAWAVNPRPRARTGAA